MSCIDIEGKLKAVEYFGDDFIIVRFRGNLTNSFPFDENTPVLIHVTFEKDYKKRMGIYKEFENIKGLARYDYAYERNKTENKFEQISKTKILEIEIIEDLENFELFGDMRKNNSEIAVRLISDGICSKEELEFIKKGYDYMISLDPVPLSDDIEDIKGKYFPIKDYMLFTYYNQNK